MSEVNNLLALPLSQAAGAPKKAQRWFAVVLPVNLEFACDMDARDFRFALFGSIGHYLGRTINDADVSVYCLAHPQGCNAAAAQLPMTYVD